MIRTAVVVFALGVLAGPAGLQAQAVHAAQARASAGDAENGAVIFQHTCVMCHSVTQGVKIVGPSLYSEMRGPHASSPKAVREIIVNGKGQMPAMGKQLSDQDIADLLAYVRKQ